MNELVEQEVYGRYCSTLTKTFNRNKMINITAVLLNPKDHQVIKMIFRDYMFDLPENKFHTLCDRALVIKGMMCPCAFCSPRRDSVRPLYTESHLYIKGSWKNNIPSFHTLILPGYIEICCRAWCVLNFLDFPFLVWLQTRMKSLINNRETLPEHKETTLKNLREKSPNGFWGEDSDASEKILLYKARHHVFEYSRRLKDELPRECIHKDSTVCSPSHLWKLPSSEAVLVKECYVDR